MDSFSKTSVPPECICNNASINKPASHGSAASTEFQTVRDTFSAMKLKQTNLRESETSKCVVDNEDLEKRGRNSSELTPGDVVREFSQYSQRVRRNSFPSLELVAVDIQYSVPTKTISAPRRRSRATFRMLWEVDYTVSMKFPREAVGGRRILLGFQVVQTWSSKEDFQREHNEI